MTGPVFEAIGAYREGVDTRLVNNQNVNITAQPRARVSPSWLTDKNAMVGDVTYPMALNLNATLSGNTGAASTGTAHTHPLNGTGAAASFGAYWPVAQNAAVGGYIQASDYYAVDRLSFVGFVSTALAGGTIDVEIFREGVTSLTTDRSLTRLAVWSWSSWGTAASQTTWDTGSAPDATIITREGERLLLRVVNRSNPARTFNILGAAGVQNWGVPFLGHLASGTTNINKTSLTQTEADSFTNAATVLPWFQISQFQQPAEDRTFTDDFNRANIGPRWVLGNGGGAVGTPVPVISNNRFTYGGTTDGGQIGVCIYPTAGDASRVDADLWNVTSAGCGLVLHADRDKNSYVILAVYDTQIILYSLLNNTVFTSRNSMSISSNEATWSIYYEPTPNKYTVLKNGADIGFTWTDTGNVMPHNINTRYGGLQIQRDTGVNGGEWENFVLRDWKP